MRGWSIEPSPGKFVASGGPAPKPLAGKAESLLLLEANTEVGGLKDEKAARHLAFVFSDDWIPAGAGLTRRQLPPDSRRWMASKAARAVNVVEMSALGH